ncbi:hypothetical protein FN846DRAFT_923893 [Sphaerosporella brunnea]|uniref:NAD(P)-binding domain-containing protein n=1 Tax=Sphaerosporella brunnea TaxID=1250544 RepID=A0A5J5EDI0_9PEZI|nr:hypothetical protein FN846DRAFT_923893 [Sphaerosporella brunnea]
MVRPSERLIRSREARAIGAKRRRPAEAEPASQQIAQPVVPDLGEEVAKGMERVLREGGLWIDVSKPTIANTVNVLLLGGHGKVALHMTRLLVSHGHSVTRLIRDPSHSADITSLDASPLVSSVEEATTESARKLMHGIEWVIWSAGAGGKGGKERTKAVDEDAAKKFISAALQAEALPYGFGGLRKVYNDAWEAIPAYAEAKCAADDFLWAESRKAKKQGWEDSCLRLECSQSLALAGWTWEGQRWWFS